MLARLLARLIDAQDAWARPLGDGLHRILVAIFGPLRFLKDFLNGTWLGHPNHAALTDLPIGALTLVIIFDVIGQPNAAFVALVFSVLAMLAAAITGLADFTDTDGKARMVATVHLSMMVVAVVLFSVSVILRAAGGPPGVAPIALVVVGYLLVTMGAYVGGEVVYALGNMVSRHAWRFHGTPQWQALDVTEIPEGELVKARAGAQTLVLVRHGERVMALHEVCAHAGGPLSKGTIVDGAVECPWHGSRFEIATGRRRRGPTTYDQPYYDVRRTATGGWEARRVTAEAGADDAG